MLQQGLVVFAKNKKRVSAFYQQALRFEVQESKPPRDLRRGHLKPDAAAWHFRGHVVLDGWDPKVNIAQLKQAA